jgi:hypothetical protein
MALELTAVVEAAAPVPPGVGLRLTATVVARAPLAPGALHLTKLVVANDPIPSTDIEWYRYVNGVHRPATLYRYVNGVHRRA